MSLQCHFSILPQGFIYVFIIIDKLTDIVLWKVAREIPDTSELGIALNLNFKHDIAPLIEKSSFPVVTFEGEDMAFMNTARL